MAGLTTLGVKNAKPGRHADGRGLYLVVRDSGSRAWVLRAQIDGVRRDLGLGSASTLSLSSARAKAAEFRERLRSGEALPTKVAPTVKKTPTFAEATAACHEALKAGWSNKRHRDSWLATLKNHIHPAIGKTPVDLVTSAAIRDALAPIWLTTPETARRALQRVGVVLDYAHIQGWRAEEASLRSVRKGLPRQPVDENHFPAMPYADIPAFVNLLSRLTPSAGRNALLFTIFTAARSGETRMATWSEFDLAAKTWTVPSSRMKMKRTHIVPLSAPVIEILRRRLKLRSESDLVFSKTGTTPICDMTMTKILRDMGYLEITVHGFRSAFTDWAAEETEHPKEVVDKALAHQLVDRVEAAYRRTDFFERRRRLMNDWVNYLSANSVTKRRSAKNARGANVT